MNMFGAVAMTVLGGVCLCGSVSAGGDLSDAEWKRIKDEYLARPRRVWIDDDTADIDIAKDKEVTVGNFYDHPFGMGNLVGNEFDVLVYCSADVGFNVLYDTKTELRARPADGKRDVPRELERKFGKDVLALARDFTRSNGYEFVVNMRVNDVHDAIFGGVNSFKTRNPDLLVGAEPILKRPPFAYWTAYDYAQPKVREVFSTLAKEQFDRYDPDGFMIDFFRTPVLFRSVAWGGAPTQQEMDAFTEMLRDIRAYAEKVGRRRGRPIYFALRLPDLVSVARPAGMDVERWMREGLFDIFIAGSDIGRYGRLADASALCRKYGVKYFPTMDSTYLKGSPEVFNRNTAEAFNGHFAAAYAAGADGLYLFNMMYYPHYFSYVRRDAKDLEREDKAYFVTPFEPELMSARQPLPGKKGSVPVLCPTRPLVVSDTRSHEYVIETGDDLSKLARDDLPKVTLVLKGTMDATHRLLVRLNGTALAEASQDGDVVTYAVPPTALKCGVNRLSIGGASEMQPVERTVLSGNELLKGAKQPPWRRLCGGGLSCESIVEGAYRIVNGPDDLANLIYPIGDFAGAPVAAKFALMVEPGSQQGANSFRLANGKCVERVDFAPDRITLAFAGQSCAFDTTAFHAYCLRLADGVATLEADGRVLLTGKVGKNVGRPETQVRGNNLRILGMNEATLMLGAIAPVAGAGRWKDVRLVASPLRVVDAALRFSYPRRASKEILGAIAKAKPAYENDCSAGAFKSVPGMESTYRGFPPAPNGKGVVIDNDRTEYQMVNLRAGTGLFAADHRYFVAKWKVAFLKPPRNDESYNFYVGLYPKSLRRPGQAWQCGVRCRDGAVDLPFGEFAVPKGAQDLCVAVDAETGETVLTDGEGKVIAVGCVPLGKSPVGFSFGDGSFYVSGQSALERISLSFAD